ncbi:GNAT family N-acetyltransferase [Zestomonas thermotolerans]|uniref:GNAT family N-acetyltransferase n=1 Tax=Zestomonas thermotolerans TaxID=157784 RepID=UPI0023F21C7C|nr:GNAT family N-acetyltransferase [Pseudomonas thermotolerans]
MTLQTSYPLNRAVPLQAGYRVECLQGLEAVRSYLPMWEELSQAASEPNVFYAPWGLLPALEHLAGDRRVELLFLWRETGTAGPVLDGLVPLRVSGCALLPIARLYRHRYCFSVVPLVRAGRERAVLDALLGWLQAQRRRYPLLLLRDLPAEGPLAEALREALAASGRQFFEGLHSERALLQLGSDAEHYLERNFSARRLKEYRRLGRRLGELGELRIRRLQAGDEDLEAWLEAFVALEAKGWKGRLQSALGSRAETRRYFEAVVRGAHARGQLLMLELSLDGRPLAMRCDFLAPPGAFAFKIAYDEEFARFSPGVLLELEAIRVLHELKAQGLHWVDSCSAPDDQTSNRLWMERKRLGTFKLSSGTLLADLWISFYPHAKRLKDWLKRRKELGCLTLVASSATEEVMPVLVLAGL